MKVMAWTPVAVALLAGVGSCEKKALMSSASDCSGALHDLRIVCCGELPANTGGEKRPYQIWEGATKEGSHVTMIVGGLGKYGVPAPFAKSYDARPNVHYPTKIEECPVGSGKWVTSNAMRVDAGFVWVEETPPPPSTSLEKRTAPSTSTGDQFSTTDAKIYSFSFSWAFVITGSSVTGAYAAVTPSNFDVVVAEQANAATHKSLSRGQDTHVTGTSSSGPCCGRSPESSPVFSPATGWAVGFSGSGTPTSHEWDDPEKNFEDKVAEFVKEVRKTCADKSVKIECDVKVQESAK